MTTMTLDEYSKLRRKLADLTEARVRLEAQKERALQDVEKAEAALVELGFDMGLDLDEQLDGLRERLLVRTAALEELLL